MKKILFIIVWSVAAVTLNAQPYEFTRLTGPYLGQKPPGMKPEIFAPGILSTLGVTSESMEVILPLTIRSYQIHKQLYQQLPAETGIDYYFRESALLTLAFTLAEVQELSNKVDTLQKQGFSVWWLNGDDVRLIESRISSDTIVAIYSEETGELDS